MKISQGMKSRLSDAERGRQAGGQMKKYFRQYASTSRKDIIFLQTFKLTLSKTGARLDRGLHARKGFVLKKVHSIVWRTIREGSCNKYQNSQHFKVFLKSLEDIWRYYFSRGILMFCITIKWWLHDAGSRRATFFWGKAQFFFSCCTYVVLLVPDIKRNYCFETLTMNPRNYSIYLKNICRFRWKIY